MAAPSQALVEAIHVLFDGPQLMYWIEVLSLLGRMDVAIDGLSSLVALNLDAHRFLVSFHEAVTISTPHLYVSALAFSPHRSLTAQRMRPHFPNAVTFAQGRDLSWHPCVHSILHPHSVQSLSTSPDGLQMVTGYPDGSIAIWNNRTGSCINRSPTGHRDPVTCVTYSSKGDITIRLWDAVTMRPIHGPYIGHFSRTIRVWSVDLGGLQLAANPLVVTGHSDSVTCAVFSPDGSKIAIQIWDAETGTRSNAVPPKHSDTVTSVAFSPNGEYIASSSLDGAIQLWNITTTTTYYQAFGHFSPVNTLVVSPDGHVMSGSTDRTTRVWEPVTRLKLKTLAPLVGHSTTDGSRIVSGSRDNTVRIWDPQTGNQVGNPCTGHSSHVNGVAISPDGAHIVSGSQDKTMKLWNTTTHANDNKVYVWDFAGWKMIKQGLQGHSDNVLGVAFSPDGACIASASADRTVSLWDVETHSRSNVTLSGHAAAPSIRSPGTHLRQSVAFSPDGAYIASGSWDDTVRLWNANTGQAIGQPFTGHTVGYLISGSTINNPILGLRGVTPARRANARPTRCILLAIEPIHLSSHPDRPGWVTHDSNQFIGQLGRKAFLDYSKFVHGTAWTGRNSG
ncbi:quinon protein alcohol dehydrogenase-like superfamily [Rhizoctonia solani]|nr:quinon protein alcohol dehydrogenase-like superfamily [Rhizoctonia solani]